jgi:UDP-N-acetylmuramoyl-tripeptide--D-alanyl-D-alanine ligase
MMSLGEAARAINARQVGAEARFGGVSTDSRTLAAGELFVAIRGERFDGHQFIAAARSRGAAAAIVDERHEAAAPLPLLVVDDTRHALGRLAARWRSQFSPVLVAITGSNGKTTTREMLASILRAHAGDAAVLATHGNLNTDIGVALTLLRMRAQHRFCAIELGMNHPGEIAALAALAQPTVALVNNAQREHLEFMRSVAAVAEENASVFMALPASGIAVINADDPHVQIFRRAKGARRSVEFGIENPAAVSGGYVLKPLGSEITIRAPEGESHANLSTPGLHNVRNALAAAACGLAAGIVPEAVGKGLGAFRPYTGRTQVRQLGYGATLIDDSYNANPDSVRAAIDVLAAVPGQTLLVLGDMGEVGEHGPEFHAEVGRYARERGIGTLFAVGEATRATVAAFGAGARHFEDWKMLVAEARDAATVLVKGSRFMKMERIVAALGGERAGGTH